MAFSWQEQVKPAGTQDIQCDIEYLDKSYIHVYLDGAETTAFTWTSSTNIRLNSPLSAETVVLLIRKTEREYLYIEFVSGAPFIEGNVDTQNTQFLHLAQELVEGRAIDGFYGDISMHGYRITNLGAPAASTDATNKQYVDDLHDDATSRADAQFSRTLRVPEAGVGAIPGYVTRRNRILAFDSVGDPIAVLPESGSAADVLIDLASEAGASNIGTSTGATVETRLATLDSQVDPTLRQNLGSSEEGFGSDIVSLALQEYINEKGLFSDTSITHWFGNPTFESFGAIPNDTTKADENAVAINKALEWSRANNGRPISPTPGAKYYISDCLELVDRGDGTGVGTAARIVGPDDMSSKLYFVGGDGSTPAIRALGNLGTSGSKSARGVQITGLYIDVSNWLLEADSNGDYPAAIHLENISLWGVFTNFQVWNSQGRGVLAKAVTECFFGEIEVRAAKSYGWEQYEPNPTYNADDPMFMECSYNRYVRVKAFSSNNFGTQALFTGGNALSFEHCKFSEGLIGVRFVRTHGVRIDTPYFDGTNYAEGEKVAIQIDGPGAASFSISGGRCWNCHVGVDFVRCDLASVMDLNMDFTSPAGSTIYGVRAGASVTLPVYTNVATYLDNSTKGIICGFMRSDDTGYSPSWAITNGSVSVRDGTQTGRKTRNFNKVEVNAKLVVGSTTVIEGTNLTLVLPYSTTASGQSLACIAYDASDATYYHGRAIISGRGATLVFEKPVTAYSVSTSTAYPFYPASGDYFQIEGYYFLK